MAGCGSASVSPGGEGASCRPNGSCNPGLTCASNLCVSVDGGAGAGGRGRGGMAGSLGGSGGSFNVGGNGGSSGGAGGAIGSVGGTGGAAGSAATGGGAGSAATGGTGGSGATGGAAGSAAMGGAAGSGATGGGGGSGGGGTGGTVAVDPPQLVAPLSTATVTSQKPTLRWKLASGSDGAHVQICHDRACTKVITTFDATGNSGAPPVPLPAGVVFWNARGRQGTGTGQSASPTWQFNVGKHTAAVDTSFGTTADVNGDGYADLLIGSPFVNSGVGRVYVHFGGPTGPNTTPDEILSGTDGPGAYFGGNVAPAGDINGDGYGDVLVAAESVNSSDPSIGSGVVYLYLGGAGGLSDKPFRLASTNGSDTQLGQFAFGAGDVNGDGYGDFVLAGQEPNAAYIYFGGPLGPADTANQMLYPITTVSSPAIASAGDVNGDGYGDIVVGGMSDNTLGTVYLYLGSKNGFPSTPNQTINGPQTGVNADGFGENVFSAGDVDGDGYADVVVECANAGGGTSSVAVVYFYRGGKTGLSASPAATLTDSSVYVIGTGIGSGDFNNDGYADLVVGEMVNGTSKTTPGQALVFLGGAGGISTTPAGSKLVGTSWSFGQAIAGAGDVNGDGYADVIFGDTNAASNGQAYLYLGQASGIASKPAMTFNALDGVTSGFGTSVY